MCFRFLADADWELVEKYMTIENPYKTKYKTDAFSLVSEN